MQHVVSLLIVDKSIYRRGVVLEILVTVTTTTNGITLRGYNTSSVDNLRGIIVTTPSLR